MNSLSLFVVIAAAVACGIALAPHVGTIAAIFGGLTLLCIALVIAFAIAKGLFRKGVSLFAWLSAGVRIYFRAIPWAWSLLITPASSSEQGHLSRRFDGLVVLLVCVVWAIVIIGFALLLIFLTHAHT